MTKRSRWLPLVHANPEARLRLFCFPYAGAGASFFVNWWRHLPGDVEICPVELPGRWSRWQEEPLRDVTAVSTLIANELAEELRAKPFALYGHSLGALVAYETAVQLQVGGAELPRGLLVSARRPPDAQLKRPALHSLDDDAFVQGIARFYEPIDPRLLHDVQTRLMLLKLLRADMEMFENYRAGRQSPIDVPIVTFAARDDASSPPDAMDGWQEFSVRPIRTHVFDGGHFFVRNCQEFWRVLQVELTKLR